jgi:nucleoid DNA-binding protein
VKHEELITKLMDEVRFLSRNDVRLVVKSLCEIIADEVRRGKDVKISGFGVFGRRLIGGREGRNPRTGEAAYIPSKYRPTFRSLGEFKEAVNR